MPEAETSSPRLLNLFLCHSSRDKAAVVNAWVWFQAAGISALIGYAVTGTAFCFGIGVITLAVMHLFSPNRFQGHTRL